MLNEGKITSLYHFPNLSFHNFIPECLQLFEVKVNFIFSYYDKSLFVKLYLSNYFPQIQISYAYDEFLV